MSFCSFLLLLCRAVSGSGWCWSCASARVMHPGTWNRPEKGCSFCSERHSQTLPRAGSNRGGHWGNRPPSTADPKPRCQIEGDTGYRFCIQWHAGLIWQYIFSSSLQRQVFSALGQIAKHSVDVAEMVVEAEIFPATLVCLKDPDEYVRKNVAILIREITKHTPRYLPHA